MTFSTAPVRRLAAAMGVAGSGLLLLSSGCHSAFVNASIINRSGHPLRLVEIDYPSASFGTNDLPDGGTFKYRFKILGTGPASLLWTDAASKDHKSQGPNLEEGQEGELSVVIGPDQPAWVAKLSH